jgi:putative lipoic acid-binding regulatory protein
MSLMFLDCGTNTFVGSTCIAYGSVTMPLIAADYLAEKFWTQVLDGDSVGYALMRAKLTFAQEMTRKQGFLDGEDQKTLLSFVLFGDPLAVYDGPKSTPKSVRAKSHPAVKTLSDSDLQPALDMDEMPKNVSAGVKEVIEKYLPGLHNAQMKVNTNSTGSYNGKKKSSRDDHYYVTLEKSVQENQQMTHHHYARMTFDKKGKLVKFSTSR